MDFKILKRLITMVEKSEIDELEVEHENLKVRIKKSGNINYAAPSVGPTMIAIPAAAPDAKGELAAQPPAQAKAEIGGEPVISPMVGTFYRSPSPGKPNFVEEGDVVKKGDIVCIIEAMKLMNEIEAPFNGKVTSILIDNAQPVEFGEKLLFIQPN